MELLNDMRDFSLFTLETKERLISEKSRTMFIFIRPNMLTIQHNKNKRLYVNSVPIELSIDLTTFEVKSNYKSIPFVDFEVKSAINVESTKTFNSIKGFTELMKSESSKKEKYSKTIHSTVDREELEELISFIEKQKLFELVDQALDKKDKNLFEKLTEKQDI